MKKILILVDKLNDSNTLLAESISVELKHGDSCTLASFNEVLFHIKPKKVMTTVRGIPLTDFNVVHFRRTGHRYVTMAYTIASILKKNKINLVNTTYNNSGASGDKVTSLVRLALNGLPTIESFYVSKSGLKNFYPEIEKNLKYPMVAKDRLLQRGRGVFLIENKEKMREIVSNPDLKSLIFQSFVKGKQEFRLLVLGDSVKVFERKVRTDNEFRANVSLGATEEFLSLKEMPKKMEKIAVKAATTLGLQVAGVDIMEDIDGNYWLIEVNRGPGLTHDKKASPELTQVGKYFARELLAS